MSFWKYAKSNSLLFSSFKGKKEVKKYLKKHAIKREEDKKEIDLKPYVVNKKTIE